MPGNAAEGGGATLPTVPGENSATRVSLIGMRHGMREPWAKVTVVLPSRHVAYLDGILIDIRLKHGKALSRAQLIRGLIEATLRSYIDLSNADTTTGIMELLVKKWRRA